MRIRITGLALAWTLGAAALSAAPTAPEPKKDQAPTPVEKIRQGLDKTISVESNGKPLSAVLKEVSDATGVPIVLDQLTIQQLGMEPEQFQIHFKGKDVKARTALRSILGQFNLSFAVVGDHLLVTTDEMAMYRQMRQRVNIDFDNVEFAKALKQLARETGTNLILDARSAKEAKGPVTLQLEDVPLETAVRLMAEMVGLKPVRVGNVMFIGSKAVVADLRQDPDLVPPPNPRGVAVEQQLLQLLQQPGGIGGVPNPPPVAVPVPPPPPPQTPPSPVKEEAPKPPPADRNPS